MAHPSRLTPDVHGDAVDSIIERHWGPVDRDVPEDRADVIELPAARSSVRVPYELLESAAMILSVATVELANRDDERWQEHNSVLDEVWETIAGTSGTALVDTALVERLRGSLLEAVEELADDPEIAADARIWCLAMTTLQAS